MRIVDGLLSLVFPNVCIFCDKGLPHSDSGVYICDECMERLNFCINSKRCKKCGDIIGDSKAALCNNCYSLKSSGKPVYYHKITAPLVYDNVSKDAIISLKSGKYLGAVGTFCGLIEAMVRSDFSDIDFDYIVSVPPRIERMLKTRFDQAEILASTLAHRMGIKYIRKSMKRVRRTKKQSELSRNERFENLKGAFVVRPRKTMLEGKNVLVIDDVCTTGSTINECARAIHNAGAAMVCGAAIAKTSGDSKHRQ